ncbi:MAG: GNAT family N-acetyltransferase [Proteobacteria bacterium]|nr:GNAT family N-acetyltransferase [Pseudomonadota bacterium]MBU1233687.1 GNAT family N-acetyltransferase [Pseudomonadota bacterium]MBU1420065.1 GNAT family N-acetyltransferase [Pseudomonadota bacterium]MBU1456847.1 GNAT family N-acetyltransferase [Pseudomonadota bacterium]
MQIRNVRPGDLEQIINIYNQAVAAGNCTADIEPLVVDERREWFAQHSPDKYPIYVMEEAGIITGWCSLSAHRRGRKALECVAEISYYVDFSFLGRGIGQRLISHALHEAPDLGLHNLFAILLDINKPSIAILEKNGFSKWGHLPDIAEFPNRICGQYIYGRKL